MFTKGQKIALLSDWDRCGTVQIRRGTVHSCGKKVMKVELADGKMLEQAIYFTTYFNSPHFRVVVDATDAELEALALSQAEEILAGERDRFARCLAGGHGEGYNRAIQRDIDRLHDPKVFWG